MTGSGPVLHAPRTVVIQRNPRSGTGWRRGLVYDLVTQLRSQGFRPRLFKSRERLDRWLADPQHRADVYCLVAAGGDGTLSDLVNRQPGLPITLLPVGTENVLAQGLGIPASGLGVARMIAAGNRRRLDLGELNGRRFVLMVSAGFDAEVVHRVHRSRRGHLSHWSYVPAVVQALWGYAHPQMRVWSGRETSPAPARLVIVVNFPRYALGLRVASGARTDDGLLDARLFARGSRFQMLRYFCSLWWSRPEKLADVACLTTNELRLESDQPVPLQADGDPAGTTPAVLRVLPGALELLVPAPTGSHAARADAKGME